MTEVKCRRMLHGCGKVSVAAGRRVSVGRSGDGRPGPADWKTARLLSQAGARHARHREESIIIPNYPGRSRNGKAASGTRGGPAGLAIDRFRNQSGAPSNRNLAPASAETCELDHTCSLGPGAGRSGDGARGGRGHFGPVATSAFGLVQRPVAAFDELHDAFALGILRHADGQGDGR